MMALREGAPAGNENAVAHGLHSKHPARRVAVQPDASYGELAQLSATLGDAAQWIAETLNTELADITARDAKMIGLYAAVAGEMAQLVAEILGETGIKPSPLGRLDDAQYDILMRKLAEALSLVLSQCVSAWKHLETRRECGETATVVETWNSKTGASELRAHPVLNHLAAHIRAAKRLMRDMAANRAWREHGQESLDDLGARLVAAIEGRKES